LLPDLVIGSALLKMLFDFFTSSIKIVQGNEVADKGEVFNEKKACH